MKITKEEKSLWNFLNIFKNIFSKTNNRTIVYGMNNSLYLYTLNYAGKFISKQSQNKLMPDYTFGSYFYELKQLPNSQFVLDFIDNPVTDQEIEKIIKMIEDIISNSKYCCDVDKHDEFKIAKITETTGLWMADSDVRYLNTFPEAEIYSSCYDSLVIKANGITDKDILDVETSLVFKELETVHSVQQKMDIEEDDDQEDIEKTADELIDETEAELEDEFEDEFEDDFDPMLA